MKPRKFKYTTKFATTAMLSVLVVSMHIAGFELLVTNDHAIANEVIAQSTVQPQAQDSGEPQIETIIVTATRL